MHVALLKLECMQQAHKDAQQKRKIFILICT